jgi:hypothetical protein
MIAAYKSVPEGGGAELPSEEGKPDIRLRMNVVFTTAEATLAALRAAGELSKSLEARIALVAVEVVHYALPLDQPPIPIGVFARQLRGLVTKAQLEEGEVVIDIYVGRDRRACLQQVLQPGSLVVVGGRPGWWSREHSLAQWLGVLGRKVLLVDHPKRRRAWWFLVFGSKRAATARRKDGTSERKDARVEPLVNSHRR